MTTISEPNLSHGTSTALPSLEIPEAEFGTSADGFPVARVGEHLLALVTRANGGFSLVRAWCIAKPLGALTGKDFHTHCGPIEDEAAFRDRVIETACHIGELSALSRIEARLSASTPWGTSQFATVYADGVMRYSTAGHGGFHLSRDRNGQIDRTIRHSGGWYEEDAEWAIVASTFPELFTGYERRCAEETVRNSWPDFWERMHGRLLEAGESWAKDRAEFDRLHAESWVVASAIHSEHHSDMIEVIATMAGKRQPATDERRFLVPKTEYANRGRFGFIVDPDRHFLYDGPSSFAGR